MGMRGMGGRNMEIPGAGGGGRRQFGSGGGRNPGARRSPMGNIGPMGPMGSIGPMGPMGAIGAGNRGGVQQDKAAVFEQNFSAAMQKTSLVQVAIAGKLTLFQPPAVDESAIAGNDPSGATTTDPATTLPPTGDTQPANGVGTDPETKTTEEPAVPGTSPDNTPANGAPVGTPPAGTPPAGTPPTNATPLPNTEEKAAPTPETSPANEAAKPAATQPE